MVNNRNDDMNTSKLVFAFGSIHANAVGLYDLYLIHQEKIAAGQLSFHPHRWLSSSVQPICTEMLEDSVLTFVQIALVPLPRY